jgi:hypothetical protein
VRVPYPIHVTIFDLIIPVIFPYKLWKLLIMQSSPVSHRFLHLMSKYSQYPNNLNLHSSFSVRYKLLHSYKTNKITGLHILYMRNGTIQNSEQNGSKHFPNLICSWLFHACDFDFLYCRTQYFNCTTFQRIYNYLYITIVPHSGDKIRTYSYFSLFLFLDTLLYWIGVKVKFYLCF